MTMAPRWESPVHFPMGFDKNSEGKPVVQVEKRTTKVNISMIVGVVLFFILGALGMARLHRHVSDHGGTIQPGERHETGPG